MQAGDLAAQAEAQADAVDFPAPCGFAAVEALEGPFGEVGRDVVAGVFYAQHEALATALQRKPDPAVRHVVLGGIAVEVVDQLQHQALVADAPDLRLDFAVDLQPGVEGHRVECQFRHERREANRLHRVDDAVGIGAREQQQFFRDLDQALDFVPDQPHPHLRFRSGGQILDQLLRVPAQDGQRRAQLVRCVGGEAARLQEALVQTLAKLLEHGHEALELAVRRQQVERLVEIARAEPSQRRFELPDRLHRRAGHVQREQRERQHEDGRQIAEHVVAQHVDAVHVLLDIGLPHQNLQRPRILPGREDQPWLAIDRGPRQAR